MEKGSAHQEAVQHTLGCSYNQTPALTSSSPSKKRPAGHKVGSITLPNTSSIDGLDTIAPRRWGLGVGDVTLTSALAGKGK